MPRAATWLAGRAAGPLERPSFVVVLAGRAALRPNEKDPATAPTCQCFHSSGIIATIASASTADHGSAADLAPPGRRAKDQASDALSPAPPSRDCSASLEASRGWPGTEPFAGAVRIQPRSAPLVRITPAYQRALSLGVRASVSKSTWTSPNRGRYPKPHSKLSMKLHTK